MPSKLNEIAAKRFAICEACDRLNKAYLCKECSCFMPAKVLVKSAQCPLDKWSRE